MKLYYYEDPIGNFGDDLNPLLWDRLLHGLIDDDDNDLLLGVGTLLKSDVPGSGRKLVLGTGAGYGRLPELDERWHFYCVRGPLTAARLGLDPALAVTDGAILLAALDLAPLPCDGSVVFMPHHRSCEHADWSEVCRQAGVVHLDPRAPAALTLDRLRRARLVIAEAMHGAIAADALRIPWIAAACYDHILAFKWQDWCASLELDYRPAALPGLWQQLPPATLRDRAKSELKRGLRMAGLWRAHWGAPRPRLSRPRDYEQAAAALARLVEDAPAQLSADGTHGRALERMLERTEALRRDVRAAAPGRSAGRLH